MTRSRPRRLARLATAAAALAPLAASAWLPERARHGIGAGLGRLAWYWAAERRHVVRTNLALCLPELDPLARECLARAHFRAAGIALTDSAYAWLRDARALAPQLEVRGREHLEAALADTRGVLLLGGHFLTLELAGALLSTLTPADVLERPHDQPLLRWLQRRGRARYFKRLISRRDPRTLVRRLRAGHLVWYALDQDPGRHTAVFAPLFGVPAAVPTAPLRIAQRADVCALFVAHWREPASGRLVLAFQTPPAGFPSGQLARDAAHVNTLLETGIRARPEQYLWLHRRFKTRPNGGPSPYES